jgi:hypothetical protein
MAAEGAAPGRLGNGGLAVDAATASSGVAGLGGVLLFVALIAVVVLWCVPLIIAGLWNLPGKGAIAVLSLALGWTGVAWQPPLYPPPRRPQYACQASGEVTQLVGRQGLEP